MRYILWAVVIFATNCAFAEDTPLAVKNYLTSTESLSTLKSDQQNLANELQQKIQKSFFAAEHGGINIMDPDIYLIGAYDNSTITGQRYSILLKRMIFDQHSISIDNQSEKTKVITRPAYPEPVPHLYQTTIKRIISYNGNSIPIWQRINVSIPNDGTTGLITKIASSKSQFNEKKIIIYKKPSEMTADELMDLAAEYYSKKNHKLAYDTYRLLTQKYETNPDGWLELAVMTYYEQGYSNSNYRKDALKYINKALEYLRDNKKREEAETFKLRIEHPNYY